jgi:hypothetical protein
MQVRRKDRLGDWIPALLIAIIAVVCTAGVALDVFVSLNDSRNSSDARMITAAALSRAGAIEALSEPLPRSGI